MWWHDVQMEGLEVFLGGSSLISLLLLTIARVCKFFVRGSNKRCQMLGQGTEVGCETRLRLIQAPAKCDS